MYYKIMTKYSRFSGILNVFAALTTAAFAILTAPVVDSSIANLTGMNADKFPTAQKILGLVTVIWCWSVMGMFVTMFVFLSIGFHTVFKKATTTRASTLSMIALVGISYTLVIFLNAFSELSHDLANKRVKVLLVYSSFHVSPERCGIAGQPENSSVALLDDDKAILAVADEKEVFTFKPVSCPLPLLKKTSSSDQPSKDGK